MIFRKRLCCENATLDKVSGRFSNTMVDSEGVTGAPLLPNTTYTYRVRAVNLSGSGPWSNEESLTTLVNLPSAPAQPTGAGLDSDSIEVSWMAPTDNGGDTITAYELEVRTVDNTFRTRHSRKHRHWPPADYSH